MDIDVFSPREHATVFRTLRSALNGAEPLNQSARLFLETYARIVGFASPIDTLPAIEPRDVALEGAHQRKRLVQLSAIAALLSRPVRPASVEFVKAVARQLGTHDPVLSVLDAVIAGRFRRVRLLAMRRIMRVMLSEARRAEGAMGIVRLLAAMLFKVPVNRDKLASYKRLGLLPEGTLGREYWKHMTTCGFGFPGEFGGIPDTIVYHDIAHVLADHPATGLGEIQQGSFQAGNRREDGFFFIQFVLLHFHQGIRVSPSAPTEVGHFDPQRVLWAVHRGAQCNVDMTSKWNFWPLMTLTLEEARKQVGLLPKLTAAA